MVDYFDSGVIEFVVVNVVVVLVVGGDVVMEEDVF